MLTERLTAIIDPRADSDPAVKADVLFTLRTSGKYLIDPIKSEDCGKTLPFTIDIAIMKLEKPIFDTWFVPGTADGESRVEGPSRLFSDDLQQQNQLLR